MIEWKCGGDLAKQANRPFLLINSILFANEDEAVAPAPRSPGPPTLKQPKTTVSKAQAIILRIVAQEGNR